MGPNFSNLYAMGNLWEKQVMLINVWQRYGTEISIDIP